LDRVESSRWLSFRIIHDRLTRTNGPLFGLENSKQSRPIARTEETLLSLIDTLLPEP